MLKLLLFSDSQEHSMDTIQLMLLRPGKLIQQLMELEILSRNLLLLNLKLMKKRKRLFKVNLLLTLLSGQESLKRDLRTILLSITQLEIELPLLILLSEMSCTQSSITQKIHSAHFCLLLQTISLTSSTSTHTTAMNLLITSQQDQNQNSEQSRIQMTLQ